MLKYNQVRLYFILSLVALVLGIGLVVFIILINALDVTWASNTFRMLVIFLFVIVFAGFIYLLKLMFDTAKFIEQLELENYYTLGNKMTFYNYDAFKNKAFGLSKNRRLKAEYRQFVIAFTCSPAKIASNQFHNEMITSLNYHTAMYLTSLLNKDKSIFSRTTVYGFNRGTFLIYMNIVEENEIPHTISLISAAIYRIVTEKSLKVYAQPFFGIRELKDDDDIIAAIEDAMIARSVSENNFETYTYYSTSFKKETSRDDITDIEEALRNDEFLVYYQPKYSLKEHRFISCEALARWNSSKYGFLTPAMFIDKAESAGLISLIDNFIFEKALQELSQQIRRGRRVLPVSVNFSIYEFYSQGFIDQVVSLLDKYKIPPALVEIEITETTSQANQFLSISIIKKLKDLGIRVLMDDFGVGYSGIDNLRKIPFDAIKIDKSFADLILEDKKTESIVDMIIKLGHVNDIEVIIEGVDNQAQVDLLDQLGVDTIQGFYYSKPMPLLDYDNFLKQNMFEEGEER